MGLSITKREIRLQSGILHYKMGFLLYKRDSRVAIHQAEILSWLHITDLLTFTTQYTFYTMVISLCLHIDKYLC